MMVRTGPALVFRYKVARAAAGGCRRCCVHDLADGLQRRQRRVAYRHLVEGHEPAHVAVGSGGRACRTRHAYGWRECRLTSTRKRDEAGAGESRGPNAAQRVGGARHGGQSSRIVQRLEGAAAPYTSRRGCRHTHDSSLADRCHLHRRERTRDAPAGRRSAVGPARVSR